MTIAFNKFRAFRFTVWLLLFFSSFILPWTVFAGNYGEGTYGVGNYNVGATPTPTPTTASTGPSSSGISNSSTPQAPTCSDKAPGSKTPWLYGAVTQDSSSILLYFTEADDPVSSYALEFGTKSGEYTFGAGNIGGKGTRMYLVQSLAANTIYYFRVRGGNGCATGGWSNELSAKTRPLVVRNVLDFPSFALDTRPFEEQEILTSEPTDVTTAGDAVQSETQKQEGKKFKQTAQQAGYKVKVKVTDASKKPIPSAKVTIHSKVQESVTNKDGIAEFTNVEPGEHRVIIAYQNYEGEHKVNLTGDVKEFELTVSVQPRNIWLAPQVIGVSAVSLVIIVTLCLLLISARKRRS